MTSTTGILPSTAPITASRPADCSGSEPDCTAVGVDGPMKSRPNSVGSGSGALKQAIFIGLAAKCTGSPEAGTRHT
ncbi:Uncharacterised protein [Mycobacteroides abscessus subsp. abscessus]|nr:Uncharacterised protein [Mycobacteroides abscessus subsp. abscessus]